MIITSVESAKEADFRMLFDPTLVRGMSYYTGTIFEISMDEFGGSVGGGGRYDKMIGKFTGQDTPAVGFSIGFERIVMLLMERGYKVPTSKEKKAFLIEKNMSKEGMLKVLDLAKKERAAGRQVMIMNMKKNKKFQKEQLAEQGYTDITECYRDSVVYEADAGQPYGNSGDHKDGSKEAFFLSAKTGISQSFISSGGRNPFRYAAGGRAFKCS